MPARMRAAEGTRGIDLAPPPLGGVPPCKTEAAAPMMDVP